MPMTTSGNEVLPVVASGRVVPFASTSTLSSGVTDVEVTTGVVVVVDVEVVEVTALVVVRSPTVVVVS